MEGFTMDKAGGMTDNQFKAFLRLLISNLNQAMEEKDAKKQRAKLQRLVKDLNAILKG